MPNTVSSNIVLSGAKNAAVEVQILGDGSGEQTATVIVDSSALNSVGEYKLLDVQANLIGVTAELLWDATANVHALYLSDGASFREWYATGGLTNEGGAGKTGDILITTVGLGSGDKISMTLRLRRRSA